ncbi:MAG TPA: GAF domain-containing sensor histidine kinase [Chloroflexota bacterium]
MSAYLDRIRRLSALLYLVSVAIVLVASAVPSSLPIDRPAVYALLAVAVGTGALVYWFPWRQFHPSWFLLVGISASAMIALLIALTGGRGSIFFPLFVFVVVASGAYYSTGPLIVLTAAVSLASLAYALYQPPSTTEDLLRSAVEIAIYAVAAFLCRTLLRGLELSDQGSRQVRAEVAEHEQAEQVLRLLTEASAALSASLDYDQTLQTVARLAVPAIADWCLLDIVDSAGRVERVAAAAANPAKDGLLQELQRRFPLDADSPQPAGRALRTGEPVLIGEVDEAQLAASWRDAEHAALVRRIGTTSMVAAPLSARGRTLGALTLATGESGRRYGQRDLALAVELARRAAMALDNARLHRDLQRALATRDEFLSHAAHDLKNPLTTARAQSQLLRTWALRDVPPAIERVLQGFDRLDTSITKMARLIDELRDVANLEVGRPLALKLEAVDLVALARQAVAEYQLATRRHQLRVETELDALVGTWDGGRLDRVLANLLDNALKYSPNGGEIAVTVGREAEEAGGWAVLSVRDPGIGIPPADRPQIFNRYHRAANVVRRIVGSGIGLAGVRAILEQHGGRIDVESEEGVGSTFTLRLPLAVAAERLVQNDRDVEAASLAGRALDGRSNLG